MRDVMLYRLTRLSRPLVLASGFGLLASASHALMPAATASTLPHIPESCFTYSPGQVTREKQGVVIHNMQAELTGTSHHVIVLSSTVNDHRQTLDEAALVRLNAAAAYAALTAYHQGLTASCASQPLPEVDEVRNTLPELNWKGITISRPGQISTASAARMRLLTSAPDIRLVFGATGLHSPGALLLPSSVSGDVTFTPSARPPYQVTINKLHTSLNGSDIEGDGHLLAGEGKKALKGEAHFSISHIGDMIEQLGKVAPTKITAALVIARLMGEQEPNHRTGWRISLEDGTVRVNGIRVPVPF